MNEKFILDACCSGRQFWIDKKHKNTVYMDIRSTPKGTIEAQPNWCIEPDVLGSYLEMPFEDSIFNLVIWDVPHAINLKGIIGLKYGELGENWKHDLSLGFKECMRILKPQGILIFKFNDLSISFKEVLSLFSQNPIGFTPTKKGVNNTAFFVFIKEVLK